MKNDKLKSQILLPLYLAGNGMLTGQFLRLFAARDQNFHEMAPMLIVALGAWILSANRAIHHYNNLYNNKQK